MFGYQDLVLVFRGIPTMKQYAPLVLDVTNSLQQPNQPSGVTGGRPALIGTMSRAGIAAGADGLFIETHFDPSIAKSDGANMLPLQMLEKLLTDLVKIKKVLSIL
jgi:2-dehydro-3-deoxyphosphooctonate aldolase (KDO 8-P synthase)